MLSRKHFKAIADILGTIKPDPIRRLLVEQFASYLRGENPNFDSERFKQACESETINRRKQIESVESKRDNLQKTSLFSWFNATWGK
jgi:hypothetical protein